MKRYLLDTNVLVAYVRGGEPYFRIQETLDLTGSQVVPMISVVSVAEMWSLVTQFGWGNAKKDKLRKLINKLLVLDINYNDTRLIDLYAQIDAYSQRKHPSRNLTGSARNMGKNDLWIAASAVASQADLVTMDADFDHMNPEWLTVIKFKPSGKI